MAIVVHVARNGKRYWQLYYVDPVTEQRHWRSAKTTDRRAAERSAAKWEAELAEGLAPQLDRVTWAIFRDRFESEHLSSVADKTAAAYRTALGHVERLIKPARLASVTSATLSQLAADLRREGKADTSVATYLQHVASALSWAETVGLLSKPPAKPKIRGTSKARHRPATGEELDRMLAAVSGVRDCRRDVTSWQRYLRGLNLSGLRLGESIRLSWDEAEPFAVVQSGDAWHYRIYAEGQKSRRDQLLPVTPDFAELLSATPPDQRHGPVFPLCGPSGKRIRGQRRIARIVAAIAARANCQVSAHDFRRAFGTRWAQRVLPPILRQLMRHKDLATTMRYYVHLDTADVSAALRAWQVNPLVNPANPDRVSGDEEKPARNDKTRCQATGSVS